MEWVYNSNDKRWTLIIGDWRATVAHAQSGDTWYTTIERLDSHHERYERPDALWPQDGRAWCIEEIARPRAELGLGRN